MWKQQHIFLFLFLEKAWNIATQGRVLKKKMHLIILTLSISVRQGKALLAHFGSKKFQSAVHEKKSILLWYYVKLAQPNAALNKCTFNHFYS